MRRIIAPALFLAYQTLSAAAPAQESSPCPPPYAVCLTEDEKKTVGDSLRELKEIKEAKARLVLEDDIVIVRDWQDRVYVNGGEGRPLRAVLKVGPVERDMEVKLPIRTFYRERPPEPMFRLRIRAQAGVLVPSVLKEFKGGWDAGVGWDFMHLGPLNLSAYTGIRSAGGGLGLDLTKNFGPYAGYAITYDGWRSAAMAGVFFSLN
jgi:hypothetical protein